MNPRRPEVKVLSRESTLQVSNPVVFAEPDYSTSPNAHTNRWTCMSYIPSNPHGQQQYPAYSGTSQTVVDNFNNGIFALKIPQGTQADQRIGAEINVLKDMWSFKWYVHSVNPTNTAQAATSITLLPRYVKIRMVGVFQNRLLEPGQIGYSPSELFERTDDLHSKFKRDAANGYQIIYDKTKRYGISNWVGNSAQRTVLSDSEAIFAMNYAYRRRYGVFTATSSHGGPEDGNIDGVEVATDQVPASGGTVGAITGGTAVGQIIWYYFIEDLYPFASDVYQNAWAYPLYGWGLNVHRRTYWSDA